MTSPSNLPPHEACYQNEIHCIEDKDNGGTPIAGKVTGAIGSITANIPTRLPLTTVLFKTPCIKIPQDGGITVQEDGEYFISFDGTFPPAAGRVVTFSVFTPNFSGTALSGAGIATLAELVCLRAGDTVYVTVTSNATITPTVITGILVVTKVRD